MSAHDDLLKALLVERYGRNGWWNRRPVVQAEPEWDDSDVAIARRRRELAQAWSEKEEEASDGA